MMEIRECLNLSGMSQKKGNTGEAEVFSYYRFFKRPLYRAEFMNLAKREYDTPKVIMRNYHC